MGARRHRAAGPRRWDTILVIALGGAMGAVGRYLLSLAVPHSPGAFPWATFTINVAGCLLIGVLMVFLSEASGPPHRLARPFLGVGLLGGFTTFSTYTVETQQLLSGGAPRLGFAYLLGTLAAALLAVQIGIATTRAMISFRRRERGLR